MTSDNENKRRDLYYALVVAGIVLLKRVLIAPYGINREAGGEIEAVLHVLEGKLIYRDFLWYHGFLPIYLNALSFKLVGAEMYLIRLQVTIFAVIAAFFAYRISRFFLPPGLSIIASLLAFSGLVTPEHVSGHMMAICLQIISFYFLLRYLRSKRQNALYLSAIFGSATFLSQIFPIGVMTLFGSAIAIICFAVFDSKEYLKGLRPFLLAFLPIPIICYGLFSLYVPIDTLYQNLFPMFSGLETRPTQYAHFPIPSLLPDTGAGLKAAANRWVFVNFRWWLIVLVFVWGLVEFFLGLKDKKNNPTELMGIGALVLFGVLFEIKFLIYIGRLGLVPNYINMLPTYTLLLYLMATRINVKSLVSIAGLGFLAVFFIYPFTTYYFYYAKNAVALNLPHSSGIYVSPYKKDLYNKIYNYVVQNTKPEDFIVTAGVNRHFSVFSGRRDFFWSNFLTFLQASFYPSRRNSGFLEGSYAAEKITVEQMQKSDVKLILFPEDYKKGIEPQTSPFLEYLEKNWEKDVTYGDETLKNPFEWESPIGIYKPKQTGVDLQIDTSS